MIRKLWWMMVWSAMLLNGGCIGGPGGERFETAAVRADAVSAERIDQLELSLANITASLENRVGGDQQINEPIQGWIIAVGLVLATLAAPVSIVIYVLAHRSNAFVRFKGARYREMRGILGGD